MTGSEHSRDRSRHLSSSEGDSGRSGARSPSLDPPDTLDDEMQDPGEMSSGAVLEVVGLTAGYGKRRVISNVNISVLCGEIVALIGRNGTGKSTLLKTIFGILPAWTGQIRYAGGLVSQVSPKWWLSRQVAYIPQGGGLFGDLTVKENLDVSACTLSERERQEGIEWALAEFPGLRTRLRQRASTLSGGEKQMVTLAMSLVVRPRLLLMDEPSLGLAPPLVREALDRIDRLRRDQNTSVLIVEQKVREVLRIADSVIAMRSGMVCWNGRAAELRDSDEKLREAYL